jgi:DNA end-binding protein Ku
MAQRPIWRGHLRLALVSCPVALYTAKHERNTMRFNLVNPKTGNRIRMLTVDAGTEEEVVRRDLVKGYEFKKNHYLLLTEADFDSIKIESSAVMTVDKFVDAGAIDPIYYDTSYYVAADGAAGRDVYWVLREAIGRTGRVAMSRVVIGQRERVIALRPVEGGLAAHTLYEQRDLNDAAGIFDAPVPVDEEMVQLATQLIDRQTRRYEPADTEDRYETRLRALIDAKLKGEGFAAGDDVAEPARGNVVDLMAALKRSLGVTEEKPAVKPGKPRESVAEPAKPRRKKA